MLEIVAVIENAKRNVTAENVKQKEDELYANYIIISLLLYMNIQYWCKQNYGFCFLLIFITICYLIIPSISQIEGLTTPECTQCRNRCKTKKSGTETNSIGEKGCIKQECGNLCKVKSSKKGDKQDKKEKKFNKKVKKQQKINKLAERGKKIQYRMEKTKELSDELRKKYKAAIGKLTKAKQKQGFRTFEGDDVGGEPFYGALNY